MLLLGVIIVKITNKDGTVTEIKVPEGAKVEILNDETRRMAAPGRPSDTVPNTKKTAEGGHPTKPGWHGWPADAPAAAIAPFDAERAKQHQRAWADYLKLPVEYTNSIGMKFVLIPPGEFTMGSTPEEIEAVLKEIDPNDERWLERTKSEGPQHKIILTQASYMGIYEVTQKEYAAVMGTNPSHFSSTGAGKETVANLDTQNHPVEMVSWNDAAELCAKLSQKDELKPFYFRAGDTVTPLDGTGYRLTTEAEWEFACRAGTTTKYWIGDQVDDLMKAGWFGTNSAGRTHAAGELKANSLGLFDIHGNAREWVNDGWEPTYYSQLQGKLAIDPDGQSAAGSQRVHRGGDSHVAASACRSSFRYADVPTHRSSILGFRIALPADAVRQQLKLTGPAMAGGGRGETSERRTDNPVRQPNSEEMTDRIVRPTAPIDFAAERKAAERFLRLGKGKAFIGNKNREFTPQLYELKSPLPGEDFRILAVDLRSADLTDDELAVFVGCRGFNTLNLGGNPKLTAAGLTQLGSQPYLKELYLQDTRVGDELLPWLKDLPALEHLKVFDTSFTNNITAGAWASLPPCPRLKSLTALGEVGDGGLRRIVEQCPELRGLTLMKASISDFSPLTRLTRLNLLHTDQNALSDASIETLLKLPALDQLLLDSPDQAGLERLRKLNPKLTTLHFRSQEFVTLPTGDAWKSATEMSELLELQITGNIPVDGAALQRVAAMPKIRRFVLWDDSNDNTKFRTFTEDDVREFREARPDVALNIGGQTYPALADWPGKFEGSTSVAPWPDYGADAPPPAIVPFSAEAAQQHQTAWAEHLKQPVEYTNTIGMKFRLIPPGETVTNLGTPQQPRNALQRLSPYYMGTTEVTVGQFKKFVEATGYVTDAERLKFGRNLQGQPDPNATWKAPGYAISEELPMNIVSPADAQAFCNWLNAQEKDSRLYRLPTELEWEVACRAGGAGDYGFADTAQAVLDYAWTAENVEGRPIAMQPVATKRANPFGLFDMLGNVWEWPTTDSGSVRGVIGASIFEHANSTSVNRFVAGTQWVQPNVGFRVLRQLEASEFVAPPKFASQPVLVARGAALGSQVAVMRPAAIPGLRSWTVELAAHQFVGTSIAWSPQGDVIATTSEDMTVRLWDREGNLKSILLGHLGATTDVSFSPDGTRLVTVDRYSAGNSVGQNSLRIWDVPSGACLASLPLRTWGQCVAWSPDGTKIAYGGTIGMCDILDLATGQVRSLKIEAEPGSLAWSADSQTLCVPEKGLPVLFDVTTGERLASLAAPDAQPAEALANRVAWSPDGRWIAGAAGKQVHIWDASTKEYQRTITTKWDAGRMTWHHESRLLAVMLEGHTPIVVNAASGEITAEFSDVHGASQMAWSTDGKEFLVHSSGLLRFYDAQTGKLLRSGPDRGQNHNPSSPVFLSADGQHVHVKHHDLAAERLEFDAATGQLTDRRKSPSGYLVATAPQEQWRI